MLAQTTFDVSSNAGPGAAAFIAIVALVLTAIVHICFAMAVFADAGKLSRPALVGPVVWALATLLGGVVAAGIYWVMNRSTLCGRVASGVAAQARSGASEPPRGD